MNLSNEQSPHLKRDEEQITFPSILETEQPMLQSHYGKNVTDPSAHPTSIHDLLFGSRDLISPLSKQEANSFEDKDKNDKKGPRTLKRSNTADLTSHINPYYLIIIFINNDIISEGSLIEASPVFVQKNRPSIMLKKSEELSKSAVFDSDNQYVREPASAGLKSSRDDMTTSLGGDIITSKKKGILKTKPVTISMTFDAFMDQIRGIGPTSLFSNYPSHKIDKRLM